MFGNHPRTVAPSRSHVSVGMLWEMQEEKEKASPKLYFNSYVLANLGLTR